MSLHSRLFRSDAKLQACLLQDSHHVAPGAVGDHVSRIQTALACLDDSSINALEIAARRYGPSTAAAVLSYKKKRSIINPAYQTQADNIVGKMTIASLDKEILQRENRTRIVVETISCRFKDESDVVA
jgi:peptidoglycan hydrolase-like protein with peptidoglycan-binding domain